MTNIQPTSTNIPVPLMDFPKGILYIIAAYLKWPQRHQLEGEKGWDFSQADFQVIARVHLVTSSVVSFQDLMDANPFDPCIWWVF